VSKRFFNGIEIDVPEGWTDLSTVIIAPRTEVSEGKKPSINLVVKRRPAKPGSENKTMHEYLAFMKKTFGKLDDIQTKEMMVGSVRGQAVRFTTEAGGKRFTQMTLLYQTQGDEISATVTQLEGDPTPVKTIEKLLRSIRPAAGGVFGVR
jgi:hypothetical protein